MAGQIDHPVLITECPCNPVQSRSKMAELLFETYGVPSVGMSTGSFYFDIVLASLWFEVPHDSLNHFFILWMVSSSMFLWGT